MKNIVFVMLLCTLMLSACAATPTQETPATTEATVAETTAAPQVSTDELYKDILAKLYKKLDYIIVDDTHLDGFADQEGMVGIAEIAALRELDLLDKIGYAIIDINNDGVEELIFTTVSESAAEQRILSAYTVSNNKAVLLFAGGAQNGYYLLKDSKIFNRNYAGDSLVSYGVYQIEKGSVKLSCTDFYFAAEENGAFAYYQNQSGSQDVAVSGNLEGGAKTFALYDEEFSATIQYPEITLMSSYKN